MTPDYIDGDYSPPSAWRPPTRGEIKFYDHQKREAYKCIAASNTLYPEADRAAADARHLMQIQGRLR